MVKLPGRGDIVLLMVVERNANMKIRVNHVIKLLRKGGIVLFMADSGVLQGADPGVLQGALWV